MREEKNMPHASRGRKGGTKKRDYEAEAQTENASFFPGTSITSGKYFVKSVLKEINGNDGNEERQCVFEEKRGRK